MTGRVAAPPAAGRPFVLTLAFPATLWLALFVVVPLVAQAGIALMTGDPEGGYRLTWSLVPLREAVRDHGPQLARSLGYAGAATLVDLVVALPVAYLLATRAGRARPYLLALLVAPFLVGQVLRATSLQLFLADRGPVADALHAIGVLGSGGHLLATPGAVVAGLALGSLPFMVLPLYAALSRIDPALREAAGDLGAAPLAAFLRVTLPLAAPGALAGALLVFVPATGDVVSPAILGGPGQTTLGGAIQGASLTLLDYPSAAALSFVLVAAALGAGLVARGALTLAGRAGVRA